MRVLVSGYYGFGNLGDEALLEVIVQRLRATVAPASIEVLSASPQRTADTHGVDATARWDWRAVRAAIARSDVVLSGGGGLLQNATSLRSLLYYAAILREGARLGRKTMNFAQSIGPLDRLGRFTVRRFCRGVRRATVRDERSRRLLQELLPHAVVERTADPVFLYDPDIESVDLSSEGLGPESGPYAIVERAQGSRHARRYRLLARAIDRLATRHGIRAALFLAARRGARRSRGHGCDPCLPERAGLVAGIAVIESGGDDRSRTHRYRDAFTRARLGGALCGAIPRRALHPNISPRCAKILSIL